MDERITELIDVVGKECDELINSIYDDLGNELKLNAGSPDPIYFREWIKKAVNVNIVTNNIEIAYNQFKATLYDYSKIRMENDE